MNINRQQQISLASVQSKSMTYGAAIASSNARNMAVSNLNRMSNATNPWRRNIAQQTLEHNWLEYQDNLVEQASGQTTERQFFREALGQVKAAPANLLQKSNLQSADYSLDPAEPTNEDIYAIGAELFEEVPKGEEGESESLSMEQIGAMERAGRVSRPRGRRVRGGWRAELGLPADVSVLDAPSYMLGEQSQQQSMITRGGIADALLAYEQGGREFAQFRQTTLLQPELFDEFRAEVRQEPIYEAEALEQGVQIDFGVDDQGTLKRTSALGRRRRTPKTIPIAGQEFAENLFFQQSVESRDNAFDAGLPSQQFGGAAVSMSRDLTIDELMAVGLAEIQDYDERTDFISFANRFPGRNKEKTLKGFRDEQKMRSGVVQGGSFQGVRGFEGGGVRTLTKSEGGFSLFN
jgi:hypothetical protein